MANKVRLGDLLVRDGLITEANLRTMLAQQKQHGGRLGEHLIRVNLCTETDIAQALARQLGIPFNDLSDPPAPAVAKIIPRDVAVKVQALAVGKNPFATRLEVAFADPTDNKAILEVEKAISRNVAPQSAPALELRRAIESAYYSLELRDDGTSEFQVTGLGGTVKKVQVRGRPQAQLAEEDLPELSDAELEPIAEPVESAPPPPVSHPPQSFRVAPRSTASVTPVPAPSGGSESGEEALRMVWVLADLLIEQGHFTRAELMKRLRAK